MFFDLRVILVVLVLFTSFSGATLIDQNNSAGAIIQRQSRESYLDPEKIKKRPSEYLRQELKEEKTKDPLILEDKKKSKSTKIRQIKIKGKHSFKKSELSKILRPYLFQELGLKELEEIASQLTNLHRKKGFSSSKIYLPAQKIKQGIVFFEVKRGKIGPISLKEGKFFKSRSVLPRLKIYSSDELDLNEIQNELARLNKNPDLGLKASLKKSKKPGETELELKIEDRFPVHLSPFVNNQGNRLIGKERYGLSLVHNNLLGFSDREVLSGHFTDSSYGISNNYEIPLVLPFGKFGKYGKKTRLGFNYAYSQLKLGKELSNLNVEGFSTLYAPYILQELIQERSLNLSADLTLDFKNLETNILKQRFIKERLRVLKLGLNLSEFDRWGRTFLRLELGQGLNFWEATDRENLFSGRAGSGPDFLRSNLFLTRITQLPWEIQNILKINLQYSDDLLNSAEQSQLGGAFTVRGYKEGQFSGDSSFLISSEFRIPCYLIPHSWGFYINKHGIPTSKKRAHSKYLFREKIRLVGFIEGGATRTNKAIAPARKNQGALGIGGGLRVELTKFLTTRLDIGIPIYREDLVDEPELQVHLGLQSQLF